MANPADPKPGSTEPPAGPSAAPGVSLGQALPYVESDASQADIASAMQLAEQAVTTAVQGVARVVAQQLRPAARATAQDTSPDTSPDTASIHDKQ